MKKSNILVISVIYQSATLRSLKTHIESVHEKIKYSCNQCDYQATQKGNLKTHIETVHEKVKYPCNQCGHQFSQQGYLKRHIQSVHEKIKLRPLNSCVVRPIVHHTL